MGAAPPKRGFWGVADDAGAADEVLVGALVVLPNKEKAGLGAESPPLVPNLKGDDVSALELGGMEKRGFGVASAVEAGAAGFWLLSLERFENRPPPPPDCAG